MCDGWDLDGVKVFVVELSTLSFSPGEGIFVGFEDVLGKPFLIRPEELVLVDLYLIKVFLCKAKTWGENTAG